MKRWQRLLVWVIGGLLLLVILAVEFMPAQDAVEQLVAIPIQGNEFRSIEMPLTHQERELLGGASAAKRMVYPQGVSPFLFSAVDGTRNRHAVHDPRYCFVGAGWQIVNEETRETPRGPVQVLTLEREGARRHALFWFSSPEGWFVSPMTYWAKATWRRLTLGVGGEEPILLVAQTLKDEPIDNAATLRIMEELDPWK